MHYFQTESLRLGSVVDQHQFPDNEEPNILGHGLTGDFAASNNQSTYQKCCLSSLKSKNSADDYHKYNKCKMLLNFEDVSTRTREKNENNYYKRFVNINT